MTILSIPEALQPSLIYFLVLVTSSCFVIYYRVYFLQATRWRQSNIPFLQSTFLIGHKYFLSMTKHSYSVALDRIYRENQDKELVAFFMGTIPLILLRDPKLVHQLFVKESPRMFGTGFATPEYETEAQHMINFTDNWKTWKFSRTTLLPIFSTLRMGGSHFAKIRKQVDNLWRHTNTTELDGRSVSLKEVATNFVIDTSSLLHFGEDSNSYEKKGIFRLIVDRFFESTLHRMISVYGLMQFPAFQAWKPFKFLSHKSCAEMSEFIQRKMKQRDQMNINKDDFIDFLRSVRDKNGLEKEGSGDSNCSQDYEGINMRQMVGFSLLMLIAGSDTVSGISALAIHLLSLHPEYQDKIRREVCEVMKRQGVSEFEFQVVQELEFTLQCLYETARLYPIQPLMMRHCTEDFQIPGTKYLLRKGDRLVASPYPMHRDPKYFKNPHKFDPDRFSPEYKNAIPPETYLSFGIGCRKCPGYKQGLLIAATLVASMLHRYKVKPRSHLQQMDVTDFHPRGFINVPARDVIVDLVRCEDFTRKFFLKN